MGETLIFQIRKCIEDKLQGGVKKGLLFFHLGMLVCR